MTVLSMTDKVTNIVVAGLGGQGVIKASDILADAVFRCGFDVKKAEIHGMSQRGGSVSTDIRFGRKVFSPMVPAGEADYLLVLAPDQVDNNMPVLKPGGILITPDFVDVAKLESPRSLNIALLGAISHYLQDIPARQWQLAIESNLPAKLLEMNLKAFEIGRQVTASRG